MLRVILLKTNTMEILSYRERQGKTMEEMESSAKMMGYSFLVLVIIASCSILFKQLEKRSTVVTATQQEMTQRSQASR